MALHVSTPPNDHQNLIRFHSPYCEATGPIVEEGTVAERVRALQDLVSHSNMMVRSHTPQRLPAPCRLTPDHIAFLELEKQSRKPMSVQRSQAQLAQYVRNVFSDSAPRLSYGAINQQAQSLGNQNGLRSASMSPSYNRRRRKNIAQGLPERMTSQVRRKTWKQTIMENAAARAINLRSGHKESITDDSNHITTVENAWEGLKQSPTKEYVARQAFTSQLFQPDSRLSKHQDRGSTIESGISRHSFSKDPLSPVPVSASHQSIAEQLTEMIDRAIDGRDMSARLSTEYTRREQNSDLEVMQNDIRTTSYEPAEDSRYAKLLVGFSLATEEHGRPYSNIRMAERDEVGSDETSHYGVRRTAKYAGVNQFDSTHRSSSDTEDYVQRQHKVSPRSRPRVRAQSQQSQLASPTQATEVPRGKNFRRLRHISRRDELPERGVRRDEHHQRFRREEQHLPQLVGQELPEGACQAASLLPDSRVLLSPAIESLSNLSPERSRRGSPKRWRWWKFVLDDKDRSPIASRSSSISLSNADTELSERLFGLGTVQPYPLSECAPFMEEEDGLAMGESISHLTDGSGDGAKPLRTPIKCSKEQAVFLEEGMKAIISSSGSPSRRDRYRSPSISPLRTSWKTPSNSPSQSPQESPLRIPRMNKKPRLRNRPLRVTVSVEHGVNGTLKVEIHPGRG